MPPVDVSSIFPWSSSALLLQELLPDGSPAQEWHFTFSIYNSPMENGTIWFVAFDWLTPVPALRNRVPGRWNWEGICCDLEWDQHNIEGHGFLSFMVEEQSGVCKAGPGMVWQIKEKNFLKIHQESMIIWNCFWERARNRGHLIFGAFWAMGSWGQHVTQASLCFQLRNV